MDPEKTNFRKYGNPPYQLILLHGGPGAAGYAPGLTGDLLQEVADFFDVFGSSRHRRFLPVGEFSGRGLRRGRPVRRLAPTSRRALSASR